MKELRDLNGNGTFYDINGNIESGESLATYLLGPRGPEYRRDDNTWADPSHPVLGHKARWYLYDGLGSVLGEVDEQGNIVDKDGSPTPLRIYDVYGFVRNSTSVGPTDTDHKFVGQLGHTSEDNTGLIYMRARYYDPSIGRFISEDPAESGVNWYLYCNSNPVNLIDPDGRNPDAAFAFVGELLRMLGPSICTTILSTYLINLGKKLIQQGSDKMLEAAVMMIGAEVKRLRAMAAGNLIGAGAGSTYEGMVGMQASRLMANGIADKFKGYGLVYAGYIISAVGPGEAIYYYSENYGGGD